MSKTALLPQNDNLAIENLKQSVGRSVFNLSHTTSFPIDVDGAILPVLAMEVNPTDSFDLSNECLLRQLTPLKVPLMTNLKLQTAYYYVSNRCAWKKWSRFISGGRSGNEVFDIPTMCNRINGDTKSLMNKDSTKHINYKNSLHTYMHVDMHNSSKQSEMPLAFPFFDYQLICRDFYTNIDRINENPDLDHWDDFAYPFADWSYSNLFPVDDDEVRLQDGLQMYSGYNTDVDSSTVRKGFMLDKVRYHDVRDDYFTLQKVAPLRGNAPSIEVSSLSTFSIPSGTKLTLNAGLHNVMDLATGYRPGSPRYPQLKNHSVTLSPDGSSSEVDLVDLVSVTPPPSFQGYAGFASRPQAGNSPVFVNPMYSGYVGSSGSAYHDAGSLTGNLVIDRSQFNFDNTLQVNLNQMESTLVNSLDGVAESHLNLDITAADIRFLSQMTVWQELNMLHKPTYNDFLNAHYENVRVGDSLVESAQYIGGTSQIISINEILQTSASSDTSPLGTQGATSMSLAANHVGNFFCPDYGFIIGVAYVLPELLYNPAMPRAFSRRTKEDYYFPEFANLSMQATLNKELFFSNDDEWNNTPLGYTGAFDELRSIPNFVAGDFLNDDYQDLKAWILRREFTNDNKPSLSQSFLSLKGNVDSRAWQVQTDANGERFPKFCLQCATFIKANRPMPYVAIPKAL